MGGRADWLGQIWVTEWAEEHSRQRGADGRVVAPWSTSAARIGMYLPSPRAAARGTRGRRLHCNAHAAPVCYLPRRGLCESPDGTSAPPTVPLLTHTDVPTPPTDGCGSYGRFSQYRIMRLSPSRPPPHATYQLCRHAGRGVQAPPAPGRGVTAPPALGRDGRLVLRMALSGGTSSRHRLLPDRGAPRATVRTFAYSSDPVAIAVVSSWMRPRGEQQLPPARSEMSRRGAPLPRGQRAAANPIRPTQGDDARCW